MEIGPVQGGSLVQWSQASKAKTTGPSAAGSAKPSPFAIYDPADANQDGVVTAMEQRLYDLQHPSAAKQLSALAYADPADANRDGVVSAQERQEAAARPRDAAPDRPSPFAPHDPADANPDGRVTALEQLRYDQARAPSALDRTAASPYGAKGASLAGGAGGLLDLRA